MLYKVTIWDLPTRIFHWLLMLCFFFMIYSGLKGGKLMQWHLKTGILILILIIFRIIWGFIGSDTARFINFVKGPKSITNYIKNGVNENTQPGHNPLGALMIVSLIFLILLQLITGLLTNDENTYLYSGYLVSMIKNEDITMLCTKIHTKLFWVILLLVTIHILVIFYYKHVKKLNLVTPMITGIKYLNQPIKIKLVSNLKALIIFTLISAIILAIFQYIPK